MKKPWKMTKTLADPRILNESYPMNTNMTGLRWILIIFAFFFIDNLPGSLSMGYLFYLQVYFGSITNPCRSFTRLCTSTGTPSSFHILPACTSKYQPQMNKSKWIGNRGLAGYASSVSFGHPEHCFLTVWTPKFICQNFLMMTFLRR